MIKFKVQKIHNYSQSPASNQWQWIKQETAFLSKKNQSVPRVPKKITISFHSNVSDN